MNSGASFSDCGTYRYHLWRALTDDLFGGTSMLFVMLNPSTANVEDDDPTIRRCRAFAQREGATRLEVCNLFGLRSTDPQGLYEARDPVGEDNDEAIQRAASEADDVVVAWGCHGDRWPARVRRVLSYIERPLCLGTTASGQPRHPLYLHRGTPISLYPYH